MAIKQVKIPDPKLQHKKTPALRRIFRKIVNPETEEETKVPKWIKITEGSGENIKVLRWHELIDRIIDYVKNRTLTECKQIYKHLTGEPYEGVNSKKAVAVKYIEWLFKIELDETKTTDEILQELKEKLSLKLGRWGLGCPHGCGRTWTFKPTDDLSGFEPEDPAAMRGVDEAGNPTNGYLNWQLQPDGTIRFVCDRCGNIVELIK